MTQMGLEYMKQKETARHNVQDEGIRSDSNTISQQDADTRKYTSSFEPQKVAISKQQADASSSQANTASGRLSLDSAYRERETQAKEQTAGATVSQADTAKGRLGLDSAYRERETAAKETTASASSRQADVARDQYGLDFKYRPRETQAKELSASAQDSQADSAARQADNAALKIETDKLLGLIKMLDPATGAGAAAKNLGWSDFDSSVAGLNSILSQILGNLKVNMK